MELVFQFGNDIILVRIEGNRVIFANSQYGCQASEIDGMNISKEGVIKEFPDLKDNPEWRGEAIKRFKEHIRKLDGEDNVANYIIDELKKYGYIPKFKHKGGWRKEALT